jgi:hypothetical protein
MITDHQPTVRYLFWALAVLAAIALFLLASEMLFGLASPTQAGPTWPW